jgi:hypothetical protein
MKKMLWVILAGTALRALSYAQEAAPPPPTSNAASQNESASVGGNLSIAPGSRTRGLRCGDERADLGAAFVRD